MSAATRGDLRGAAGIEQVPLGRQGLRVSELGLGCMVMSGTYGDPDVDESVATFHRARELGITFFDTADVYSAGENERLVGNLVASCREEVVVATKFGLVRTPGERGVNGRPEYAAACCEESLRRLRTEYIDLYYLHRVDPVVPIEESVGAMGELVQAGNVRFIGLCEVTPAQLRRAHVTHPVTALQSEWSLWARAIEQECVGAARELGIGVVPYGPLGRGFLAAGINSSTVFAETDHRSGDPRLSGENLERNLGLLKTLEALGRTKGSTPAQIALAWLKAQGDDVVPIPGTERREFLEDNVGSLGVRFTPEERAELEAHFPVGAAVGNADQTHLRDLR